MQASENAGEKNTILPIRVFNNGTRCNEIKIQTTKGVSLVEGMTAAGVLGLAVTVFMTLQTYQKEILQL